MGTRMNKMMDDWMELKYGEMIIGEFTKYIKEHEPSPDQSLIRQVNQYRKIVRNLVNALKKVISLREENIRLKKKIRRLELIGKYLRKQPVNGHKKQTTQDIQSSEKEEELNGKLIGEIISQFEIIDFDFMNEVRADIAKEIKEQAHRDQDTGKYRSGHITEHHLPTKSIRYAE